MKFEIEHLNRSALAALLFTSVYHIISLLMAGSFFACFVFLFAAVLCARSLINEQSDTKIQAPSQYTYALTSVWIALILVLFTFNQGYSALGVWFSIAILSTAILLKPSQALRLNTLGLTCYWIFASFFSAKTFNYIDTALGLSVLTLFSQIIQKRITDLETLLALSQKTDHLTGCILPSNFQIELHKVVQLYDRYKTPFSIICIKYDTSFNTDEDLDIWLKELTYIYKSRLRNTDILCRFNTQKFMLLLPSTNIESAKSLAQDLNNCAKHYEFSFKKTTHNSPILNFSTESYFHNESLESWFNKIQSQ